MKKQKTGELLPVSQRDLALYLNISSSLLSMTNTGRHGERNLGAVPATKKSNLLTAHLQFQKSNARSPLLQKIQNKSADDCARLARPMTTDANFADTHVPLLERRLNEMVRNQQQDMQWINTVNLLLSALPKNNESADDRIWLQHQQQVVLKRLQKNGLPAQVKLETQIEMKKAKAKIYRAAVKKLLKK